MSCFPSRRRAQRVLLTALAVSAGLIGGLVAFPGIGRAIVGGQESEDFAAVSLMVLSNRGGVCSGIVVAPDVVLTAAHCGAEAASLRVHYRNGSEPVLIEPRAAIRHPGYVARAVETRAASVDLMLLRLPAPLPERFRAATLDGAPQPRKGEMVTISGFGTARENDARSSGTLRQAQLPVTEPYGPGKLLIWASRPGAGACEGDSGGPMARSGERSVFAVTAWSSGSGSGKCGALTQGVLLGPQKSWIDRTMAGWGRTPLWSR